MTAFAKLLSKKQVAEILGVSFHSLPRILPMIGAIRVGRRRLMVHPEDLQAYIDRQRLKPRQARRACDGFSE